MNEVRRVRHVNDPTRIGVLTGREQPRGDRRMLQVQFSDGARWVPEEQLEDCGETRLSPLDMLESKKLGRPSDLRRTLTHVKLSGRLADVLYSMEATNTDFYAYQFKPVVKILQSPSNGILIADEVGLGKTIEAGLIWTELRSRFDMRRLLVLCPAALREKWRAELQGKMGVAAEICDAREVLERLQDPDARARGFALIASTQGLRPPRGWEETEDAGTTAKLAQILRAKESDERLVDLLVIDEAHHLRNPDSQTNALGQLFKGVAEYAVLLSATPIHNRSGDLFSLLRLLDPDTFNRSEVFDQILKANAPLVRARDVLLGRDPDVEAFRDLLDEARAHPLLRGNRQLAMIGEEDLHPDRLLRRDVRSRLAYRLETVNLMAHVVTRTRKKDVKEWRVVRDPKVEFVQLEEVEERFYKLVSEVVIKFAEGRRANEHFLLAQPQRQMSSSMAASLRSWQSRRVELEEVDQADDSADVDSRRGELGPLVSEIVRRSEDYVDLQHLIQVDTKYARLSDILTEFLREHPSEKVVVFSAFRATLAYLNERLEADGVACIQLKGGQIETKDETIRRFREPGGPSVLLSSEVGGEGVDLQFSRVVINYDLPWNPMRLEQRIGRIDRLGQMADRVLIWNVLYANTIDARIYQRLYEKLDLCRTALGDFEAILGDEIRRLELDLLSGQLSVEQQERRIDQTAQALENLRLEEHALEQDAATLVAYGDYILNQVKAAHDLHRWVTGDDIQRYVSDHLTLHYPGCVVRQVEPGSDVFEILLSDRAKLDLTGFIRTNRLSFSTRLTSAAGPVRCQFANRLSHGSAHSPEAISQFHPLVRMVSTHLSESAEQLTPAVAVRLERAAMEAPVQPGVHVLAAVRWSFSGLQDLERLVYAAVRLDDPARRLEPEFAERMAMAAVAHGQDWIEARNVIDLERAHRVVNDELLAGVDEEFEEAARQISAQNEDRADIQMRALEAHLDHQRLNLGAIRDKHHALGRGSLAKATEGRLKALESRVAQQRLRIERRRAVTRDAQEIAIAVIDIV